MAALPTVTLFLRIPVELRQRVEAKLTERHRDGAYRATLQSVAIEAIGAGLASVGANPAQLSHPAVTAKAAPAPVSKATAELARIVSGKATGARKAKAPKAPKAKAASKRGGK